MKIKYLYFQALLLCGLLASCSTDDLHSDETSTKKGFSVIPEIVDFEEPETRANRAEDDDRWIFRSFSASQNDIAGFYSLTGNPDAEDGNGPFFNVPMKFDGDKFTNSDIFFNTDMYLTKGTYYYYPYRETDVIEYKAGVTTYNPNVEYGIELRETDERDGIVKCSDILQAINTSSATTARFQHCESSIVFLRDEGFKNAENRTIKVVLNKGVSHAVIEDDDSYVKNVRFIYLKGYERNGKEMSEEDCKAWYAWEGDETYTVKSPNNVYDGRTFEKPQYITLPSSRSTSRLSVDLIEIYDDEGNLRVITDFTLYNQNSKTLYYGQRYPLVIKMKELEAQIVPVNIIPWNEDENIDAGRKVGINNESDFDDWVLAYSSFLSTERLDRPDENEPLLQYGDKTVSNDGKVSWKFYLNSDLDLSNSNSLKPGVTFLLDTFDDTLEGMNHTITGLKMEAPTPPNFISRLGENGVLKNLDIIGFSLTCTNSENSDNAGLINTCKGLVENCTIDGVINSTGKVGLLAAKGEGAIVRRCTLSGLLIGSERGTSLIFAEDNNSQISNTNSSGIIFSAK